MGDSAELAVARGSLNLDAPPLAAHVASGHRMARHGRVAHFGFSETKAKPDAVRKCPEHLLLGPSPRAMAHNEEQKRNYFAFGGAGDMRDRR
jgi:hypothetical protein